MEIPVLIIELLFWLGLFLFFVGAFFYFIPNIVIKWNAIGNIWIGTSRSAQRTGVNSRKNFFADYAIFAHHKTTGRIIWGLAILFVAVYYLYN